MNPGKRKLRRIGKDEKGTSLIEFTIAISLLLLMTFGVVEFSYALWQYNMASKATQIGARLAAVSDPIWTELVGNDGTSDGGVPGGVFPTFSGSCSGSTLQCTGTFGGSGANGAADANAFDTILYGRGGGATCGDSSADNFPGMCDIYSKITLNNIIVEYDYTGLGFSGRPTAVPAVPTVTVRLTGMTFDFFALGALAGLGSITMPDFRVTVTGEDLDRAAPS